jgi:hypothetical protein
MTRTYDGNDSSFWVFETIQEMINPNYPNHKQFVMLNYNNWKEYYPDVEEMIPDSKDTPSPCSLAIRITIYQDADHAHDMLTWCSVLGILLLLNITPIKWIMKQQTMVETSMYGPELVSAKIAS